jgi:hypothetical protein
MDEQTMEALQAMVKAISATNGAIETLRGAVPQRHANAIDVEVRKSEGALAALEQMLRTAKAGPTVDDEEGYE